MINVKSTFICITLLLLLFFSIQSVAEETDTKIVCSNSILSDLASNLIKENVSIEYIMPSGVCPAFYDATPSDVSTILSADIIISFGSAQMEPWLTNLLTYNDDAHLIECKNMGEWNTPSGAKTYVEFLTNELSGILTGKNDSIHTNSELYLAQIEEKSEELKEQIEIKGCRNKPVICMSWQKDFVEDLGLNVVHSYGPPQGLSVQDILDIKDTASNNNVCAIIDNLQSGTEVGADVASESGATHVVFTNFPGAVPGTDDYLDMITYNTELLIDGIETYEYKQGDISNLESQISNLELQRNISIVAVAIFSILALTLFVLYKKK